MISLNLNVCCFCCWFSIALKYQTIGKHTIIQYQVLETTIFQLFMVFIVYIVYRWVAMCKCILRFCVLLWRYCYNCCCCFFYFFVRSLFKMPLVFVDRVLSSLTICADVYNIIHTIYNSMLYHIAISLYFILFFFLLIFAFIPSFHSFICERCVFASFFGCFILYEFFLFRFSCCSALLWTKFSLCMFILYGFYKSHSIWCCRCQLFILVFVYRSFVSKVNMNHFHSHCVGSVSECQIIIIEKWHSNKCVDFIFFVFLTISKSQNETLRMTFKVVGIR